MKKIALSIFLTATLLCCNAFAQKPGGFRDEKPGASRPDAKPQGGQELIKPSERISKDAILETLKAAKAGEITREEAQSKIKEIRKGLKEKGEMKDIKRPEKSELSDNAKSVLDALKEKQDTHHSELKEYLAELGNSATKEQVKEAAQAFKEANKERFDAIKAEHEAIREQLKAARPARPERPKIELSEELKAKVEDIKAKRDELQEAKKALHANLKDSTVEEREVMIAEFKEANKAKHQEIKENTKSVKEEIRAQVETEATRSSDQ